MRQINLRFRKRKYKTVLVSFYCTRRTFLANPVLLHCSGFPVSLCVDRIFTSPKSNFHTYCAFCFSYLKMSVSEVNYEDKEETQEEYGHVTRVPRIFLAEFIRKKSYKFRSYLMFKLPWYCWQSKRVTRNHISFLLRNCIYFYYTKDLLKKTANRNKSNLQKTHRSCRSSNNSTFAV